MESKKSLFEKLGLIEKVQTTPEEETDSTKSNDADEAAKESFVQRINSTVEKTNPFTGEKASPFSVENANPFSNEKSNPFSAETSEKSRSFKFDRHNEISEIYNTYNLKLDGVNTIFIIENFLKALPEYLPEDVKRQSLFDIISSSGMSLENLISDGSERLKSLDAFFDQFSTNINKNIQEREKEIEILVKKINECKSDIQEFEQLRNAQKATIDYEMQKVSNILRFVKPSKQ